MISLWLLSNLSGMGQHTEVAKCKMFRLRFNSLSTYSILRVTWTQLVVLSIWKSFYSEHTSLPDYKGGGSQCWAECVFSLHCQWTKKGQFPPLASGKICLHPLFFHSGSKTNARVESMWKLGPEMNLLLLAKHRIERVLICDLCCANGACAFFHWEIRNAV